VKTSFLKLYGPIFGEDFVVRTFKMWKFAMKLLSNLGAQFCRLTPDSRGLLVLVLILVYGAWIIGATVFCSTEGQLVNCSCMGECIFSFLRLTFFDEKGLDLAYSLWEESLFLFILAMIYLCFTSFFILNGFVGISGTLIQGASEGAFEQEESDANYGREAPPELEDDDSDDSDESESAPIIEEEPDKRYDGISAFSEKDLVTELRQVLTCAEIPASTDYRVEPFSNPRSQIVSPVISRTPSSRFPITSVVPCVERFNVEDIPIQSTTKITEKASSSVLAKKTENKEPLIRFQTNQNMIKSLTELVNRQEKKIERLNDLVEQQGELLQTIHQLLKSGAK
jgi:hypothetical protein